MTQPIDPPSLPGLIVTLTPKTEAYLCTHWGNEWRQVIAEQIRDRLHDDLVTAVAHARRNVEMWAEAGVDAEAVAVAATLIERRIEQLFGDIDPSLRGES